MKKPPNEPAPPAMLEIRDGKKLTLLHFKDIDWVEAAGDYMCVHALGNTHILRKTMRKLEAQLDVPFLQRINRSTIVNVKRIKSKREHMNGEYFLKLAGGHVVKLSRSYKHKLSLL